MGMMAVIQDTGCHTAEMVTLVLLMVVVFGCVSNVTVLEAVMAEFGKRIRNACEVFADVSCSSGYVCGWRIMDEK